MLSENVGTLPTIHTMELGVSKHINDPRQEKATKLLTGFIICLQIVERSIFWIVREVFRKYTVTEKELSFCEFDVDSNYPCFRVFGQWVSSQKSVAGTQNHRRKQNNIRSVLF